MSTPEPSNRDRLLAAGYEAIAERGYAGATTAEVCRRAGLSSGTFFHYFPTKEDLLLGILTATDTAPRERLSIDDLVAAAIEEASDPHLPAFVREVSTLSALPRVRDALAEQTTAHRARLAEAIADAQAAGSLRADLPASTLVDRLDLVLAGFEARAADGDSVALTRLAQALPGLVADAVGAANPPRGQRQD